MSNDWQRLVLVWARTSARALGKASPPEPVAERSLPITANPSWLMVVPGRKPELQASRSASPFAVAVLEPLLNSQRIPRLLITSLGNHRVRINGRVVPRFAVARERDVLQAGSGVPLHVSLHSTPPIGPVRPAQLGKECPVCRVAFATGCRCYTCVCGATMHCEDDKTEDGLQCAQLRSSAGCVVCKRPLTMVAGYSYLPEEETGE
jgi:hypothetical protein